MARAGDSLSAAFGTWTGRVAAFDDHVGTDAGALADLHVLADHRIGADLDALGKPGARMNDGGRVDAHRLIAHMKSASVASSPSTRATAENFQMLRILRTIWASITSWSPGTTGRLKRTLSTEAK